MSNLEPLDKLASLLGRLPGIGRRSAERMAMKLARDNNGLVRDLIAALQDLDARVRTCSLCGTVTLKTEDPCALCRDPRRDGKVLCVVEEPADIVLIERSGGFRGRYHSLGGKLSPMKGEGIRDLRVESLLRRIENEKIEEVILATNSDTEGDATSAFLQQLLAPRNLRLTRLAFGLPAGSEIAYSDPVTLSRAIEHRSPM